MRQYILGAFLASLAAGERQSWTASTSSLVANNDNHLFNSIHSAMRQWGSSLNHNGMSFFLASVPEGTKFYHGRGDNNTVTGMEWLAYEPEHALVFARSFHPPRQPLDRHRQHLPPLTGPDDSATTADRLQHAQPYFAGSSLSHSDPLSDVAANSVSTHDSQSYGPNGNPPKVPAHPHAPPSLANANPPFDVAAHLAFEHGALGRRSVSDQKPVKDGAEPEVDNTGWLHTYAAKRHLRLLYIDGMSAGKSALGTLDTQDILLLNMTIQDWADAPSRGGPMGERTRAEGLCKMANDRWNGRIDGFIRMEMGFEIIMCSFQHSVNIVSKVKTVSAPGSPDGGHPPMSSDAYMHAIASRYDGIGNHRTTVNFDKMVSAFYHDIDLFSEGPLPRLKSLQPSQRRLVLNELDSLILSSETPANTTDWQAVADMIVARYAPEIAYLTTETFSSVNALHDHLRSSLRPFFDSSDPARSAEVSRCTHQHIPEFGLQTPASRTVLSVAHTICHELFSVLDDKDLASVAQRLESLKAALAWSEWKKCSGCKPNEVCFVPVWPAGSKEDFDHPSCLTAEQMRGRWGYWGDRPGPGGPGRGRDPRPS